MGPVPQPEEERDRPLNEISDNSEIEDADHPDMIINVASDDDSDDDDDDDGYMGYQSLAQDPGQPDSDCDSDRDSQEGEAESGDQIIHQQSGPEASGVHCPVIPEGVIQQVRHQDFPYVPNLPNYMQVPDNGRSDKCEILWNQPRNTPVTIETGHFDKIKSVMSGFQLPSTNIPDWAQSLSEEQWQTQVVSKLVETSQQQEVEVLSAAQTPTQTEALVSKDTISDKKDNCVSDEET